MREIKFRAWDKKEKWMVSPSLDYAITLHGELGKLSESGWWEFNDGERWMSENFVVLQYTGLKDKNGKEIYEGDIVKEAKWGEIKKVEWDGYRFLPFTGACDCCEDYGTWIGGECEVIGNIYENPELLPL